MIPVIGTLIQSFVTAYFNTKVAIYQAKTGASATVAVAAINATAAVETRWWFAAIPQTVIGLSIALYVAKAVVWDKVVGSFVGCSGKDLPGTCVTFATDPMSGDLHWVFITVIAGYFGVALVDRFLKST
jgi:xanthine/uracil permease